MDSFNPLHVPTIIPEHEKHQYTIESLIEPTDKSHVLLGEKVKVYIKRHKSKTIPDATCQTFDLDSGNTTSIFDMDHVILVVDIIFSIYFEALLVCFEAVSGLKVNFTKSALILVGDVDKLVELADILGCRMASLPLKYLGLPLGASFKAKPIWDNILEKVDRRLASWKRLYLSKGDRVTLIKSTLSNLPPYFLSLYPIPASVAECLEKLQRDYLWGGLNDEFKYHLVNWDKVCSPITEGGLGIRKLRVFNQALLGKWLWRYMHEREAWWRVVVEAKYGSELGWGFGGLFVRGGGFFLAILDLIRAMGVISDFGMMFGEEERLSRKLFQLFSL